MLILLYFSLVFSVLRIRIVVCGSVKDYIVLLRESAHHDEVKAGIRDHYGVHLKPLTEDGLMFVVSCTTEQSEMVCKLL